MLSGAAVKLASLEAKHKSYHQTQHLLVCLHLVCIKKYKIWEPLARWAGPYSY